MRCIGKAEQQQGGIFMKNTKTLVLFSLFSAVILLLSLTPLGYIPMPFGPTATIIQIPVILGSVIIGKKGGLCLGLVFGLSSFIQCFGKDPFGVALLGINPFFTVILCIIPRMLMGFLSGLIFETLNKKKEGFVTNLITSISGSFLNSALFLGTLAILFGNANYGGAAIVSIIKTVMIFNGLAEIIICSIVCPGIISATRKFKKQ